MELDPGQMSLHHYLMVHGSDANSSDDRRIGLAIRYVAASAKKLGKPESALLVRGKNTSNFIMERRTRGLSQKVRARKHSQAIARQMHNLFEPSKDATLGERIRLKLTKTLGLTLSYWRNLRAR